MKKLLILPLVALAAACSQAAAAPPPAPKVDVPAAAGLQTAVFAGGCFWGMEGVFEHVKGVRAVGAGAQALVPVQDRLLRFPIAA